ncbi:MAG TPA: SDR family oxidoreductase [Acidimicrobiales bacterium]|nr:SDR family oxidoreductase [Acidimicrobiales bacterium]
MSRVAIVTGGASGIGRATVDLLTEKGVTVAVFDRSGDDPVDVSDPAAVASAVDRVRAQLGPIEILVNAAGISSAGQLENDSYVDEWHRALAVNLTGTMHMVRACLPDLLACGQGRIVNLASTEGLGAARWMGPYSVSKHGVVGFTKSLAVDLGRRGVTANCVCPGATLTGLTEGIPEADRDAFARRHVPVGRYARPEEIAYMIVALTDPAATFVNGSIIRVDGGQLAKNN